MRISAKRAARVRRRFPLAVAVGCVLSLIWLVPTASLKTSALTTPQSGAGTGQLPPPGVDPTVPGATPTCMPGLKGVRMGTNRAETLKDLYPGEIICGRGGNDKIIVRYLGTKVWSGPGADVINTRQSPKSPNEIRAGSGRDTATIDAWDSVKEAESVRKTYSADSPARSAAWTYPAQQPRVVCRIVNGERRLYFEQTPKMRAVNRSSQVDWQSVAWSPVLWYYNPQAGKWEFVAQNEWLWDRTYDEQVPQFPGNVWRRYTTQEEWHLWFFANYPRLFFKVAIYYYHYGEGGVPANRFYWWVDNYGGEHANPDGKSCYFTQ